LSSRGLLLERVSQSIEREQVFPATAGFERLLADAMAKVKQLDTFMHNFYKSDAEKLGVWRKIASHIERQTKAKKRAGTSSGGKFKTAPPAKRA
jgi:hypothetical protein